MHKNEEKEEDLDNEENEEEKIEDEEDAVDEEEKLFSSMTYEEQRLYNIARNLRVMKSLGLANTPPPKKNKRLWCLSHKHKPMITPSFVLLLLHTEKQSTTTTSRLLILFCFIWSVLHKFCHQGPRRESARTKMKQAAMPSSPACSVSSRASSMATPSSSSSSSSSSFANASAAEGFVFLSV